MRYAPLTIQQQDPDTEKWSDFLALHALQINRTGGGESFAAGAGQYHPRLTFTVRWCRALEDIRYSPQTYRIRYDGQSWNITDYDDFMEQKRSVKLVGEAYGG